MNRCPFEGRENEVCKANGSSLSKAWPPIILAANLLVALLIWFNRVGVREMIAAETKSFVTRGEHEKGLADLNARLDRIESKLDRLYVPVVKQ